jgi:AcrR family transcriptional regulator
MPNRGDRGGSKTRAHIAAVATRLFLARGFDDVTIAEAAAAAGVSKVTVFAHFEHKEDLLLDRLPDAAEIVRTAICERAEGIGPVEALRRVALALSTPSSTCSGERHQRRSLRLAAPPAAEGVALDAAVVGPTDWHNHDLFDKFIK